MIQNKFLCHDFIQVLHISKVYILKFFFLGKTEKCIEKQRGPHVYKTYSPVFLIILHVCITIFLKNCHKTIENNKKDVF